MQLSKLEIKGFKSFGDKITINFDQGITGIVGPNGCGKSNIVDAIRWVLGEQKTRALRSDKMENVIFNGTKNRKALQMAEVSLSFNNTKNVLPTEYSQVTITRRYFRTGESEYLLNGVTCRLKDINNLFLDTGVGSDSYAIIELKMVDDILNDREHSRRNLFEEAAGISKFKVRKKETLRKLEDADKDLERVEDLLFEINKNLKQLERQAKQTQKYFELKAEYKTISLDLAKVTISKQSEVTSRLEAQIATAQQEKLSLQKLREEKEAEVETEKAEILNREKLLASRQKTLNDQVNKIRQYESEKKIKNERLQYLNDKASTLQRQFEADQHSSEENALRLSQLEQEQAIAQKQLDEARYQLEESKQLLDEQKAATTELQAEATALSRNLRQKQDAVYQLNKNLEIAQIQISSLKQELEKNSSDTSQHTASLHEFDDKLGELADQLSEKNDELQQMQQKEAALQLAIEKNALDTAATREQISEVTRLLDSRQNEYNLTKSLVDNLEGFPEAIRFLKKNAGWEKDLPLLSDILTTDEQYRVAIENYLETFMNYYVADTEDQAYEAVNLLNGASKGRANFFVLEKLGQFHPSETLQFSNAKPAVYLAEYDRKYERLVQHILDKVYIVTHDQEQIPNHPGLIFITQNGKIIQRPYSLSGGSVGLFEGKRIGRAKNLEKLEVEIGELTEKKEGLQLLLQKQQQDLAELKSNTYKAALEQLQQTINQLHREQITVRARQEQITALLSNSNTRREDIQGKIAQLEEEMYENRPAAEEERLSLKHMEESIARINGELEFQNEALTQRSGQFNQQNIQYHQLQNKLQSITQEAGFKQSSLNSYRLRMERNRQEWEQAQLEIRQNLEKAEVNEDELQAMYDEKEQIELGVQEAERNYFAARGKIDGAEKEARELQRRREHQDAILMEMQNKLNETRLTLISIRERLSVEFELELTDEMLQDFDPATLSEEILRKKATDLKGQLEKIGPINPMAMEAYNEIKDRHDFITAQKKDLRDAKNSLIQTITEIDTVARETFLVTYDKIRENFINVFRSLFSEEDTCDLKLSDPENPLESTIDIVARPKGKKPLTINQLSGGEKTLTAISLLFAIYLIKPAPFCIFDEVDAPLDDANIDKFNNIIKKFSTDSQFIIVTHNKRTMASTDVIYGITMLEMGVSRVIPVDLRELA